jgi:hypothetical protein
MNGNEFAEELKADDYTEIETQSLEPRPAKGEHEHPFALRGLVLSGTFIVTQGNERTIYSPAQASPARPPDESIGPEGARVLAGRNFAKSHSAVQREGLHHYPAIGAIVCSDAHNP